MARQNPQPQNIPEEPEKNESQTSGRMMRFFSNPVVGIIGTIASVLGLGLAVVFYCISIQTRDLTTYVSPIRTNVVKMGQASKLSVRFEDQSIKTDVTSAQIALWNHGSLSIRPANVLKPVEIVMPGTQILEATVRKQTRDVVGFRIDSAKLAEGKVPLNWDILEQGDGVVIQLIYAGDDTAAINVAGVIEGQQSASKVQSTPKPPELDGFGATMLIIVSVIIFAFIIIKHMDVSVPGVARRTIRSLLLLLGLLSIAAAVCFFIATKDIHPPFDF